MKKPSKQLIQQWYKTLADSGFQDIENGQEDSRYLAGNSFRQNANNHTHWFLKNVKGKSNHDADAILKEQGNRHQDIADYYYYATHFLNEHNFKSELEKKIWELYANGLPYREIGKELDIPYIKAYRAIKKIKPQFSLYRLLSRWQEPKESL